MQVSGGIFYLLINDQKKTERHTGFEFSLEPMRF